MAGWLVPGILLFLPVQEHATPAFSPGCCRSNADCPRTCPMEPFLQPPERQGVLKLSAQKEEDRRKTRPCSLELRLHIVSVFLPSHPQYQSQAWCSVGLESELCAEFTALTPNSILNIPARSEWPLPCPHPALRCGELSFA